MAAFKAQDGPWTGNKLVVLSLFDGIGGIWQALNRLGIPFIGYSSEVVSRLHLPAYNKLCDEFRLEFQDDCNTMSQLKASL